MSESIESISEIDGADSRYAEGADFLRLLGLEEYIGQSLSSLDLPVEAIMDYCPPAQVIYRELKQEDPSSPKFALMVEGAREFAKQYLGKPETNQD